MAQAYFKFDKVIQMPGYLQKQMREAQWPGAVVAYQGTPTHCTTVVVDDAQPDPTAVVDAYSDPAVMTVSSNKPEGPFGLPTADADDSDTHTMTIQMVDPITKAPVSWSGNAVVQPKSPIMVAPTTVAITNGVGSFVLGPSGIPGEFDIYLKLQSDTGPNAGWSRIQTRVAFM